MTVVAVDGMGGDHAPAAAVGGAAAAALEGVGIALVGDEARLAAELARLGGAPAGLRVVHAPDAIGMGEHDARDAARRRGSSIHAALRLVRDGEAGAFVSAGNTGAILASAVVVLGRLPGVERPAVGVVLPLPRGDLLLIDAGANADARASQLVQFAHFGAAYVRAVGGVREPRVALLNIGEEGSKGSALTIEVHARLAASALRFAGNVEGRDLAAGGPDVVVTDGFTGNVALKLAEGVTEMVLEELRRLAGASWRARLGGLLLRPAARRLRERLDYRRYGAAPLLGVDGAVFIAHGSSDAEAVASAVRSAAAAAAPATARALRDAIEGSLAGDGAAGDEA